MSTMLNQQNAEDEIDLGILLLKITKSLYINIWLIVAFAILGVGTGIGRYYLKKPTYESYMITYSNMLSDTYANTLSDNLNLLISSKNYEAISRKLSMEESEAMLVSSLTLETIAEETISKETVTNSCDLKVINNLFKISTRVTDNAVLEKLQNGLLFYFNNSPYINEQVEAKKTSINSLIIKVKNQLAAIDSIKSGKSNIVLFTPNDIYSNPSYFLEKKAQYEQELVSTKGIQLVDGFVSTKTPVNPKLSTSTIIGLFVGLFLSLILILIKELKSYLSKLDHKLNSNS